MNKKNNHPARSLFGRLRENKKRKSLTVGKEISEEDLGEFVFTRESVNFNAFFLRYRFVREGEKILFSHEKRERKGEYGPTTEKDVTAAATLELSFDDRTTLFSLLSGGTARAADDPPVCGDDGPWTFLYLQSDRAARLTYSFSSFAARTAFEEFCAALAQKAR